MIQRFSFQIIHFSLFFLLCSSIVWAQEECRVELKKDEAKKSLAKMDNEFTKVENLSVKFLQKSLLLGLEIEKVSEGSMQFKRPGQMDWRYESPEKQRFVGDGNILWYFEPEQKQATLVDFKSAFDSNMPVSFIFGVGKLENSFSIEKACDLGARIKFILNPKDEDPVLQQFTLYIEKKRYLPTGAKMIDVGGNETSFIFSSIDISTVIDKKNFDFMPPKGIDIIDQRVKQIPFH